MSVVTNVPINQCLVTNVTKKVVINVVIMNVFRTNVVKPKISSAFENSKYKL